MCGSVSGHISDVPTPAPPNPSDDCVLTQEKIYSGLDNDYLGITQNTGIYWLLEFNRLIFGKKNNDVFL